MNRKSETRQNRRTVTSWDVVKDEVYGASYTERRQELNREAEAFSIGLLLRQAREHMALTQEELAQRVDKKRAYISRVENDGSNITLKTLYEIVEKGLGGRVGITIEWDAPRDER